MKQKMFMILLAGLILLLLASSGLLGKGKKPTASGRADNTALFEGKEGTPSSSVPAGALLGQRPTSPGTNAALSGEQILKQAFTTGGGFVSNGSHKLMSSIGQSASGYGSASQNSIYHGFWPNVGAGSSDPGDVAHVLVTTPTQNALNVSASGDIVVTFDSDMNEATINNSTFVVNSTHTGRHQGAFSYDSPSRTVTFTSSNGFSAGEEVTVVLTTSIQSTQGYPLANSYVWCFTTEVTEGTGVFELDSIYILNKPTTDIAAVDLDGDGDIDLITASLDGDILVLLNNGDAVYDVQISYPVSERPTSVCAADFDGDGSLDLAACDSYDSTVTILSNNGDATFSTLGSYQVDTNLIHVLAADFNGDGNPDLAAVSGLRRNVSVLLNNGDGSFASPVKYSLGSWPSVASAADLDGDGDLDLAVSNSRSSNVSVLLNDGIGTFAPHVLYPTGDNPSSLNTLDLDEDGDIDLATCNNSPNGVNVILNNGDGTFGPPNVFGVGDDVLTDISAADMDNDADIDLVVARFGVAILQNDGHGGFVLDSVYLGMGGASQFCADLDGDGDVDVAGCTPFGAGHVSIVLNKNSGCCVDLTGNVDNDPADMVDLGDLTALIDYLFISFTVPVCIEEANVDGDQSGGVDLGDLTALIDYLFISFTLPAECL